MTLLDRFRRSEIEDLQTKRLRDLFAQIIPSNKFWTQKYNAAGVDPMAIQGLEDLPALPLTSKSELGDDQDQHPPYGSNLTYPVADFSRMHQTSGTTGSPMRWLDTPGSWDWFMQCWDQIYRIIGLQSNDRVCFPFSFGPFIGFWAAFEGATRLGNLCLAGGGMTSEARLKLINDNQATVVCCTPTYALRLAEVAKSEGIDLASGSVRALVVAGEPGGSIPAIRERIESEWGARLFDHWGMTEIGSLAVECIESPGNLHILETECIPEIIDQQSGNRVEASREDQSIQGELVITNLGRVGSPLIRYRTGDLVEADPSPCACGRESIRLKGGILGRSDDMVTIRGNNVFPSSLEAILREFDVIDEYRIEVRTVRSMQHMKIEIEPVASTGLDAIEELVSLVERAIKDRLNFQAEVVAVGSGTLPRFELKGRRFFRLS